MTFYLTAEEKSLIQQHYQKYEVTKDNSNSEKSFKYKDITIDMYEDKIVLQGNQESIIEEYRDYLKIFDEKEIQVIGNDEFGIENYFGPIVVISCYIGSGMLEKLRMLNIRDYKNLSIETMKDLALKIMKIVVFESVIINTRKYNQWINENYSPDVIKIWGHNQALVRMLQHKLDYKKIIIEDFIAEDKYYEFLKNMTANKNKIISNKVEFIKKSESKYLAVVCSTLISRYLFLEELNKIKSEVQEEIPLGTGNNVNLFLDLLKSKMGSDLDRFLKRHTKYHFSNTKKILKME